MSVHPDEWRRIARLGGGQEWTLTRPDGKPLQFLDAHKLTKKQRQQIEDWAVESGVAERVTVHTYTYYDDEWEDDVSMVFETREEAEAQAGFEWMSEDEQADADIQEVTTVRLTEQHRQRGSSIHDADLVLTVWAEQNTNLDGVWWNDTLDTSRLSAPRGVILPTRLAALKRSIRT